MTTTTPLKAIPNQTLLDRAVREAEGYLELGMPHHALAALQRRGQLVFGDSRACCLLGETLRELSRFREAIAPLRRGAALRPDEVHAWLALGWCYKRSGELRNAIGALESALRHRPREPILHYNLGCYWSLAGDPSRALDHLAQALHLDGSYRDLVDDEADFDPIRNDPGFRLLTSAIV